MPYDAFHDSTNDWPVWHRPEREMEREREREREICQQEAVEKNHHVHMFRLLPILAIIGKRGNM